MVKHVVKVSESRKKVNNATGVSVTYKAWCLCKWQGTRRRSWTSADKDGRIHLMIHGGKKK